MAPALPESIFAGAGRQILIQEVPEPFNGRTFGISCISMLNTSEVICNKDPCGFAVEAFKVLSAFRISRRHTREAKINGKSLIGLACNASRVVTQGGFSLLGLDTSGAC